MLAADEHGQALADEGVRPLRGVDERDEPIRKRIAQTILGRDAAVERADERRADGGDRIICGSSRGFEAAREPEDSVAAANHRLRLQLVSEAEARTELLPIGVLRRA